MAYFDYEDTLTQILDQQIRALTVQREETRQDLIYHEPPLDVSYLDDNYFDAELRRRIEILKEFKRKLKSKKKIKPSCKTSTTLNKLFEDRV